MLHGQLIAVCFQDATIMMWELETLALKYRFSLPSHEKPTTLKSISVSEDHKVLLARCVILQATLPQISICHVVDMLARYSCGLWRLSQFLESLSFQRTVATLSRCIQHADVPRLFSSKAVCQSSTYFYLDITEFSSCYPNRETSFF